MSIEVLILPTLLAFGGFILFQVRDFLVGLFFVSIVVEDLGSFPQAFSDLLKPHLFNKNWTFGRFSLNRVSPDEIRKGHDPRTSLSLDVGTYIGRYKGVSIVVRIHDWIPQGFGGVYSPRHPILAVYAARWNEKKLMNLIFEVKQSEKAIDSFAIGHDSQTVGGRPKAGFSPLFLPGELKNEIESMVLWFCSKDGEDWYKKMMQPYKLVLLFHGPPGTGKTAIAKAISDVTCRTLVNQRLSTIKDNFDISFETVCSIMADRDVVVLLDEIDKIFSPSSQGSHVDPSTLLSLLNGDVLNGQIIVLTANDLELIPEDFRGSLLRPRRIDRIYQLDKPTASQIMDACAYFGVVATPEITKSSSMADVMDMIMRIKFSERMPVVPKKNERSVPKISVSQDKNQLVFSKRMVE